MPSYDDNAAESAVLDDALTSAPAGLLADDAVLDDSLRSESATLIADDACLNDGVSIGVTGYLIVESAILNDAVQVGATAQSLISDAAQLDDALTLTLLSKLADTAETAVLNDALTSSRATLIAEAAVLGDAMTYAFTFAGNLVEAGTLDDVLSSYLSDSAVEAGVLDDAVASIIQAIQLIAESAALNDAVSLSARAANLVIEVAVLNDAVAQNATAKDNVLETAELDDHVTGGGAGGAWLAALETFAMARWTNQPWNSMAVIGGRLVGASDDGAYFLDASGGDVGAAIDAELVYDWLNTKIGRDGKPVASPQLKRPRYLYLEYKGGQLALTLKHVQNGSEASAYYEMPARTANAAVNNRVELGRGIRSVYLKPTIANVDGSDFTLNGGRLAVDELERSVE